MARHRSRRFDDSQPGLFDDIEMPPQPAIEPMKPIVSDEPQVDLYYMSFGSGSSGNCAYIGDGSSGLLVDAGVDPEKVMDTLLHNGISPESVKGIIITHDHGDHIRYVYGFVRRYRHLAVFCTPKAFNGIMRRHNVSRRLKDYHHPIYKEFPFKVGNFEVTAFDVSHDGTDNAGFFITQGKHRFAIATDLGCITERVEHYMSLARYIMIESNYDLPMLRSGTYPEYLKARIVAKNGHLDNTVTGDFLARIYSEDLRAVFLCHLSHDNNTPERAVSTVVEAIKRAHPAITIGDGTDNLLTRNADMQLMPLPRYDSTPLYRFR